MKADELVAGETYALEVQGKSTKVRARLLRVAAKASQNAIVQIEDAGAEREIEVPKRRLVEAWRDYRANHVAFVDTESFARVAWLPKAGEEVECGDTGALRWKVNDVDFKVGTAVITSHVLSMPQTRTVLIEELHPAEKPAVPSAEELSHRILDSGLAPLRFERSEQSEGNPELSGREVQPDEERGGIAPREIAPRLVFGPVACQQYRQYLVPLCRRAEEPKRMRREVAQRGRIRRVNPGESRYKRGEYLRYRVPNRFEIVVFGSPQKLPYDIQISRIDILRKRGRRSRRGKGGRSR